MSGVFYAEFSSLFFRKRAYLILAVQALGLGLLFVLYCVTQKLTSSFTMQYGLAVSFIVVLPITCMDTFYSGEKSCFDKQLFAAPISLSEIAGGKFFACLTLVIISIIINFSFQFVFMLYIKIYWLELLCGYLGVFLIGAFFTSVCLFFRVMVEGRFSSIIVSVFALMLLLLVDTSIVAVGNYQIKTVLLAISPFSILNDFLRGIFNPISLIYMLMLTFSFLLLCQQGLKRMRSGRRQSL